MKIFPLILEIIWLILAIFFFTMGIYNTYLQGIGKSYMLFILFITSLLMYLLRRNRRLKQNNPEVK